MQADHERRVRLVKKAVGVLPLSFPPFAPPLLFSLLSRSPSLSSLSSPLPPLSLPPLPSLSIGPIKSSLVNCDAILHHYYSVL